MSGNDQFSPLPNPVMNSLVSPTKVVLNESIPNPITSTVANLPLPQNIPVSSIPVPIMSIKAMEASPSIETENSIDNQNEMSDNNLGNDTNKIIDDDSVDPDMSRLTPSIENDICDISKISKMIDTGDEDFGANKNVINCAEINGRVKSAINGDMTAGVLK